MLVVTSLNLNLKRKGNKMKNHEKGLFEKKLGYEDYKGCKNCQHELSELKRCEFADKMLGASVLHTMCPMWYKR